MKTFPLHLQSATQYECIEDCVSFVGEDRSGTFGILAGHGNMMSCLIFGLAHFRRADSKWRYLALPGAVLYMSEGELTINTRRYLIDDDFQNIIRVHLDLLEREESELALLKQSLHRVDQEILRRLRELAWAGVSWQ